MAIHKLSIQLANQIAAGEVVERPSSVVKELLENAVDAGADEIRCYIEGAGRICIKVTDNGSGIPCDELELALAPHATSKISTTEDLENITTMGFRGEALASIASVTKLVLSSRTADERDGYSVSCEGPQMEASVIPCPHAVGTTVEARELFFNTPARRRFLRSDRTELARIRDVFTRCALAHPHISFELISEGKSLLKVRKTSDEQQRLKRIAQLAGGEFSKEGVKVLCEDPLLQVEGVALCGADASQGGSEKTYLFLNSRPVADKTVMHAVREAYAEYFGKKSAARCVLYLKCDPHECDVNVHPRKDEVRFHQARAVHDLISQSLLHAFESFIKSQDNQDEDLLANLLDDEAQDKKAFASTTKTPTILDSTTSELAQIQDPKLNSPASIVFPSGQGAFFSRKASTLTTSSSETSPISGQSDMEIRHRDFANMVKSHAKASRSEISHATFNKIDALTSVTNEERSPELTTSGELKEEDYTSTQEQQKTFKGKTIHGIENHEIEDSKEEVTKEAQNISKAQICYESIQRTATTANVQEKVNAGDKIAEPFKLQQEHQKSVAQSNGEQVLCTLTPHSALIQKDGLFYLVNFQALMQKRVAEIIKNDIENDHMARASTSVPFALKATPNLLKALKHAQLQARQCGFDIEVGRSSVSVRAVPQIVATCALQELCLSVFPLIASSDELTKGRCPSSLAVLLARFAIHDGVYDHEDIFALDKLNSEEMQDLQICRELDLRSLALKLEEHM